MAHLPHEVWLGDTTFDQSPDMGKRQLLIPVDQISHSKECVDVPG